MTTPHQDRLVRTCIFLPAALHEQLKTRASGRGVSMAQVVRSTLEASIGSYRPEPRGGFLVVRSRPS